MLFALTHFASAGCKTWLLRGRDCDARRLPLNWLRSISLAGRARCLLQRINLYRCCLLQRTNWSLYRRRLIHCCCSTYCQIAHYLNLHITLHITLHTMCMSICEEHATKESQWRMSEDICPMQYVVRNYSKLIKGKHFFLSRSLYTITSSEYNFDKAYLSRALWLCHWAWCNFNVRKQPTDAQTFISQSKIHLGKWLVKNYLPLGKPCKCTSQGILYTCRFFSKLGVRVPSPTGRCISAPNRAAKKAHQLIVQ